MSARNQVVWQPSAERIERATLTRYARWLEQKRGLAFASYAQLWQWSVDDLEAFWASIWEFCDVRASAPYERVLASAAMPGARWFPGARLNFAEHVFRDRAPDGVAIVHASEGRELAELTWRRARGGDGANRVGHCARSACGRAIASSPICRTSPRPSPRSSPAPRSARSGRAARPTSACARVVDRFAQIEPKVLLAVDGYRYGGRDFDRPRRAAAAAGGDPVARAHRRARLSRPGSRTRRPANAISWEELLAARERRRARVRAAAVRPPAVGALQLGHHGLAEGHRPGPRRHPARASEAPAPARRPAAGRPPLLVHDDRLDDVELPRRRAADRRRDRALRRQSRGTRAWTCCGTSPRARASPASARAPRYLGACHEGGRGAGARARPLGARRASARRDRRSRRRASTGSTTSSARTSGSSRHRAAPTSAPRSSAACRRCRSTGASCRRARSAARSRPGTRAASR